VNRGSPALRSRSLLAEGGAKHGWPVFRYSIFLVRHSIFVLSFLRKQESREKRYGFRVKHGMTEKSVKRDMIDERRTTGLEVSLDKAGINFVFDIKVM
jgi:hypothetical protein